MASPHLLPAELFLPRGHEQPQIWSLVLKGSPCPSLMQKIKPLCFTPVALSTTVVPCPSSLDWTGVLGWGGKREWGEGAGWWLGKCGKWVVGQAGTRVVLGFSSACGAENLLPKARPPGDEAWGAHFHWGSLPSPGGKGAAERLPPPQVGEGCQRGVPPQGPSQQDQPGKASQPPAPAPVSTETSTQAQVSTICPAAGLALRTAPAPSLLQASGRGRCAAVPWVGAGAAAGRWGPRRPAGFLLAGAAGPPA